MVCRDGKKFQAHGKIWDDGVEMRVKLWLAEFAKDNVDSLVIEARFSPVDAFARSLLKKLQIDS